MAQKTSKLSVLVDLRPGAIIARGRQAQREPGSVSDRAGASEGGAGCDPQLEHAHERSGAHATCPVHLLRIRQHVILISEAHSIAAW